MAVNHWGVDYRASFTYNPTSSSHQWVFDYLPVADEWDWKGESAKIEQCFSSLTAHQNRIIGVLLNRTVPDRRGGGCWCHNSQANKEVFTPGKTSLLHTIVHTDP